MSAVENPIRRWLKAHNLSQKWLAGELEASQAQVSNWCRDKNGPSLDYRLRLVKLTGGEVTLEDLDIWALAIAHPRRASRSNRAHRLALA